MSTHRQSAFTLVEIMIVVVIIGLLSAIAVPAFIKSRENSANSRLANDFRVLGDVIDVFIMEQGRYPEDSSTGDIPSGLSPYIRPGQWYAGPSIGGKFDVEKDSYGIVSAIGVHGYTVPEAQLQRFDDQFDDGNLGSGRYRKLAGDRYYLVVAE